MGRFLARRWAARVYGFLTEQPSAAALADQASERQASQRVMQAEYRRLRDAGRGLTSLRAAEHKVYSQNGEDGILLYLLTLLGCGEEAPGRVVELCAGDGLECNSTNLVVHHGYEALLVDGSRANVKRGVRYFARHPFTWQRPPRFVQAWLTSETVAALLAQHGFSGELDLLSLDVDGVDYHLLSALLASETSPIRPRVIVLEFHAPLGPDVALTVRDDARFVFRSPLLRGASLAAFAGLLGPLGYRLVGAERHGYNAFFVDERALAGIEDLLPARTPREVFAHIPWDPRTAERLAADPIWAPVPGPASPAPHQPMQDLVTAPLDA